MCGKAEHRRGFFMCDCARGKLFFIVIGSESEEVFSD